MDELRWGWTGACEPWEEELSHTVSARWLQSVREAGLLSVLPLYLNQVGILATLRGEFATAASLVAEADAIAEATGTHFARYAAVSLAGFQGKEAEASRLIEAVTKDASVAHRRVGAP